MSHVISCQHIDVMGVIHHVVSPIHGDGSNRRSYLYIDDVCEAFDVIMHRGKVGMLPACLSCIIVASYHRLMGL